MSENQENATAAAENNQQTTSQETQNNDGERIAQKFSLPDYIQNEPQVQDLVRSYRDLQTGFNSAQERNKQEIQELTSKIESLQQNSVNKQDANQDLDIYSDYDSNNGLKMEDIKSLFAEQQEKIKNSVQQLFEQREAESAQRNAEQHNNDMLIDRARNLLLKKAHANNDSQYAKLLNDKSRPLTQQELLSIEGELQQQWDTVKRLTMPDQSGAYSPESFEMVDLWMNRNEQINAAREEGVQQTINQINSADSGPTLVQKTDTASTGMPSLPDISKMTQEQIEQTLDSMSDEQIAILHKNFQSS